MKRAVVACALLSLCALSPHATSQDKSAKRKAPPEAGAKWEYSVLTRAEVAKHGKDDFKAGLNKLGDEGWELVAVETRPGARPGATASSSYYFKRPKQAAQAKAAEGKEVASVLRLKHAQATAVVKIIEKLYGQKKGRLASDDRTNSVIVVGTAEQILELARLVTALDEPEDAPPKGKG